MLWLWDSEIKVMPFKKCLTAWLQIRKIAIENKLISPKQLNKFHSKRQNKSHLAYRNLAIYFGKCKFNPGRNLQQKLWILNWTNLLDRSRDQPHFPAVFTVYSGYQSHAPSNDFFPISKTAFWWTAIKCIHDNNSGRSFQNHYFSVNSQSIRVALSSLLDSSINRKWEVRLIKSLEASFRASRSRAMFWSCKFTNSAQPQQHETESN